MIKNLQNKTGVDLTGYDGYPVKHDTDGLALCTAKTDKAIGVLSKGGATRSDVALPGAVTKAKAIGTCTAGKYGTPGTAGVQDTSSTSEEFCLFISDGVAGDLVDVLVVGSTRTIA